MRLDAALAATLGAVGAAMADARAPWWIIGSAAVALHGAVADRAGATGGDPGPVGDVDVLLDLADAQRLFAAIGLDPRPGAAHAAFRSQLFGRWTAPPMTVEFMAGFEHRSKGGWHPVRPTSREVIPLRDVAGTVVFVPDRADLASILGRFGRPKDGVRAAYLAALDM